MYRKSRFVFQSVICLTIATTSYFVGYLHATDTVQDVSEVIIKQEIALLERTSDFPDCNQIAQSYSQLEIERLESDVVIWQHQTDTGVLNRLVVSEDFIVGVEEKQIQCSNF
ncbi:hypothetical protein MADA3029_570051 [Vibrio nigripulchritudo MADA3029]|uniref:hypothetical protein n=1 Tax=Vibrio nigripulchritudo TaxID=28173 RepID=UPI0003B17E92|nr:hypothetical protein [Vibrio nigripulchritudo]CCN47895.1 hypothetical protein VIBNIMADA3020_530009 [Vibrio nigripulchritudo MADA3020]CCN51235.1 hypothetical protein VIBNIMADA3021_1030009 [Vibrio nigripulchritudo MADA3021]CCN60363.1 hypothetical protein MADA3029_570051 [Vibrio nigripulchritudo MADA3029]